MTPQKIKSLRARFKLNLWQFAALLGVNESTVCRWELGTREPGGSASWILTDLSKCKTLPRKFRERLKSA